MALKPEKFEVFHISGVPRAPEYDSGGNRTFRGHGSDLSHYTDNIFYIMSFSLERVVTFKAFLESFKVNFAKQTEVVTDKAINSEVIKQFGAELSYDISINVPAHSVNEARNNLAKIEELQKLMSPHKNDPDFVVANAVENGGPLLFIIYLKNLISRANLKKSQPSSSPSATFIRDNGVVCSIEEIDFEPDVAAGFFEFDRYLFPKNIKLNLKFVLNDKQKTGQHIVPFDTNGQYDLEDDGGFPFGVSVSNAGDLPEENALQINHVFKDDEVNVLSHQHGSVSERKDTYFFLSNKQKENTKDKKCRWVVFKAYLESFRRDYTVDLVKIASKSTDGQNQTDTSGVNSKGKLEYKLKVNLLANNVYEAKKNCGKLSYLFRMALTKQNNEADTPTNTTGDNMRALRAYFPSFIEKPNASRTPPPSTDRSAMFENSIEVYAMNVDLEVDIQAGFFEEGTSIYPKAMSLSFDLKNNESGLINNYKYSTSYKDGNYAHIESSNDKYKKFEHLFPFNRQTIKLGRPNRPGGK